MKVLRDPIKNASLLLDDDQDFATIGDHMEKLGEHDNFQITITNMFGRCTRYKLNINILKMNKPKQP
jgi:hypothetical protein